MQLKGRMAGSVLQIINYEENLYAFNDSFFAFRSRLFSGVFGKDRRDSMVLPGRGKEENRKRKFDCGSG